MSGDIQLKFDSTLHGMMMGIIDVQMILALGICAAGKIEPSLLAQTFVNPRREEMADQSVEYIAGRAYPVQMMVQFLSGLALPKDGKDDKGKQGAAKPIFDVILGGLGQKSGAHSGAEDHGNDKKNDQAEGNSAEHAADG